MLAVDCEVRSIRKIETVAHIYIHEESGSDLSDYQVMVNLNESNFSYWTGQPLFKIWQGGAPCSYWAEFWNSTEKKARIWIKVPSIPANSTAHLVVKTFLHSVSNGEITFDFFDDFSGDLSKWSTPPSGVVIEDGTLKMPSAQESPHNLNTLYSNWTTNPQNHAIEMRTNILSGWCEFDSFFSIGFRGDSDTVYISEHGYPSTGKNWDIGVKGCDANTDYSRVRGYDDVYALETWYRFSFRNYSTTLQLVDVETPTNVLTSTDDFFDDITAANIGFGRWSQVSVLYVDFIAVRKFVTPEPSVTVIPA